MIRILGGHGVDRRIVESSRDTAEQQAGVVERGSSLVG